MRTVDQARSFLENESEAWAGLVGGRKIIKRDFDGTGKMLKEDFFGGAAVHKNGFDVRISF